MEATSSQKEAIDKDIEVAKEWGDRNNRPMYIGEFEHIEQILILDFDGQNIWC